MKSEGKSNAKRLDVELHEILIAIVRSRDDAGVEKCVELLKPAIYGCRKNKASGWHRIGSGLGYALGVLITQPTGLTV